MASIIYKGKIGDPSGGGLLSERSLYSKIVAYWPFDEVSGVRRSNGGINPLTVTGTVNRTAGEGAEYGIDCLSTNVDLITATNSPVDITCNGLTKFSTAGWIYPYASALTFRTIIERRNVTNSFWVLLSSDNKLRFNKWNQSAVFESQNHTQSAINDQWNFFCISFDSNTGNGILQLNDDSESISLTSGVATGATNTKIASDVQNGRYWEGRLSGITIFNDALTQDEINIFKANGYL